MPAHRADGALKSLVLLVMMGMAEATAAAPPKPTPPQGTEAESETAFEWLHRIRATGLTWTTGGNLYQQGIDDGTRLVQAGFNTAVLWGSSFFRMGDSDLHGTVLGLAEYTNGLHQAGIRVVEHHSAAWVPAATGSIGGIPLEQLCQFDAFNPLPPGGCSVTSDNYTQLCPNKSDVRNLYQQHITDMFTHASVDALESDDIAFMFPSGPPGPRYLCHCDACRGLFPEFEGAGRHIEKHLTSYDGNFWNTDDDPDLRAWLRARQHWVGNWEVWLRTEVMDPLPLGRQAPLWSCLASLAGSWPRWPGNSGEELNRGADLVFYEGMDGFECGYFHQWTHSISELEVGRAVARVQRKPILSLRYTHPGAERAFSWMLDRALGVCSWHEAPGSPHDLSGDAELASLVRWERDHEAFFASPNCRPAAHIGVLFSPQTRANRYRWQMEREFLGWIEALLNQNIPFRALEDTDLTDPAAVSGLQALIMPEVTCLSAQQQALVEQLAAQGVQVRATGLWFGRFNEYGDEQTPRWVPPNVFYDPGNPGVEALPYIGNEGSPNPTEFVWRFTAQMAAAADALAVIVAGLDPRPFFRVLYAPRGFIITCLARSPDPSIPQAPPCGETPYTIHLINATRTAWARCTQPPCVFFLPKHSAEFPEPGPGGPPIEMTLEDGPFQATLYSPDLPGPSYSLGMVRRGGLLQVDPGLVMRYALIRLQRVSAMAPDLDCDGDVDQDDFQVFESCATGPAVPYSPASVPPGCTLLPDDNGAIAADFDNDEDVDQEDFAVLQRCLTGPDVPALSDCGG